VAAVESSIKHVYVSAPVPTVERAWRAFSRQNIPGCDDILETRFIPAQGGCFVVTIGAREASPLQAQLQSLLHLRGPGLITDKYLARFKDSVEARA
jgi:hypothetical protein